MSTPGLKQPPPNRGRALAILIGTVFVALLALLL